MRIPMPVEELLNTQEEGGAPPMTAAMMQGALPEEEVVETDDTDARDKERLQKVREAKLSASDQAELEAWLKEAEQYGDADFGQDWEAQIQAGAKVYLASRRLSVEVRQSEAFKDATWGVSMPLNAAVIAQLGFNVETTKEEREAALDQFTARNPWYGRMTGREQQTGKSVPRGTAVSREHTPLEEWHGEHRDLITRDELSQFELVENGGKRLFKTRWTARQCNDCLYVDGPAVVDYINKKLAAGTERFVDPTFPPGDGSNPTAEPLGQGWGWPKLFATATPAKDGYECDDICQGFLGDCWLISAISIVASWPQILKGAIYPQEHSPSGAYAVRFHVPGHGWAWVLVDCLFPFGKYANGGSTGETGYASARDPEELWPMLIEKAFAKLHGGYSNLVGGAGNSLGQALALEAMTSGDAYYYKFGGSRMKTPDQVWNYLVGSEYQGSKLLVANSRDSAKKKSDHTTEHGIVAFHAYSLLGVYSPIESNARLVNLRNTWGHKEWNGAWSNVDWRNWTEHKRHCQLWRFREMYDWDKIKETDGKEGSPATGEFFMTVEDFFEHYGSMYVCKIPFKYDVGAGFKE